MIITSASYQMGGRRYYAKNMTTGVETTQDTRGNLLGMHAFAGTMSTHGSSICRSFQEGESQDALGSDSLQREKPKTFFDTIQEKINDELTNENVQETEGTVGKNNTQMVAEEPSFMTLPIRFQFQTLHHILRMILGDYYRGDKDSFANRLQEYLNANRNQMNDGLQMAYPQYQTTTVYTAMQETETTSFSTKGTVVTADGREISFGIDVEMSRSFTQIAGTGITTQQAILKDPLVIHLDESESDISQIPDQKFFFDLDADGTAEEISQLALGSGFLALDKNGDGIINDGSELFGALSGDGFADLGKFDEDENGWIDETDEIFDRLKVWIMDQNGNSTLLSLKEANVGAICLDRLPTQFSLTDDSNRLHGMVRSSGFYLHEDGGVGLLQQVDLAM